MRFSLFIFSPKFIESYFPSYFCWEIIARIAMIFSLGPPCLVDIISFIYNTTKVPIMTLKFQRARLICKYISARVLSNSATFDMRLHTIYLINDVLHHANRKNNKTILTAFEEIIVPLWSGNGYKYLSLMSFNIILTLKWKR